MLVRAPAQTDSMSRALAQKGHGDSTQSQLLHQLLTRSAGHADLDTATLALLYSLALTIRRTGRSIDTLDVREFGIFSFMLNGDSAVLGLAYGGYAFTPRRPAFWDAFGYRFHREPDGWRITSDSALFFTDGRWVPISTAATHESDCLR